MRDKDRILNSIKLLQGIAKQIKGDQLHVPELDTLYLTAMHNVNTLESELYVLKSELIDSELYVLEAELLEKKAHP
tara:strand:+ start:1209 stop:1436 length:228 start_codon:yes stop_codon:yes gene_type:complete